MVRMASGTSSIGSVSGSNQVKSSVISAVLSDFPIRYDTIRMASGTRYRSFFKKANCRMLILSVFVRPKFITLSGFHCMSNLFLTIFLTMPLRLDLLSGFQDCNLKFPTMEIGSIKKLDHGRLFKI